VLSSRRQLRRWVGTLLAPTPRSCLHCHAPHAAARLAPTGATILPVAIGPMDTGQVVHTVALFPGRVPAGTAAAMALAAKLRGGQLGRLFDERRFGKVHLEVLSAPYLVSGWLSQWLRVQVLAGDHMLETKRCISGLQPTEKERKKENAERKRPWAWVKEASWARCPLQGWPLLATIGFPCLCCHGMCRLTAQVTP